ncbi:MAG: hypothetical protein LLF76_12125 [Planctomycetaceae bacterium]|nr:hypothetical protein [Planctomycetaceae bacterium]
MKYWLLAAVAAALLAIHGCSVKHEVEVEPVEIKPIHITMDINVKVDREVDAFFNEVEAKAANAPAADTQNSIGDTNE